jgi:ABC-2 type transport system ATP-binding protein
MSDEVVIRVENVAKNFVLPHEKVRSVKVLFTNIAKLKDKTKEVQHALKDISFEVKKGEFFGIVGRNGSGKSTLLKILAGIYQPTSGGVSIKGKLVPFIELGVGFNPELTGRENIYLNGAMLGFSAKEISGMYDDIVQFAELERFMDQKLKNYSSGMQVRLAFSMATRSEADILLVDEVLAVGDADFQRKCFDYFKSLKKNNKTVVFVSHDMEAVREYCDRAILVNESKIMNSGSAKDVADKYLQLFNRQEEPIESNDERRWGTRDAFYSKVKASIKDNKIIIDAKVRANKNVEFLLFGWHINSSDGKEVFAANNRLLGVSDIHNLMHGESASIHWEIQNILSQGRYEVDVTLTDPVSIVYDWHYGAATFSVEKAKKQSTTNVAPPTKINISINRRG